MIITRENTNLVPKGASNNTAVSGPGLSDPPPSYQATSGPQSQPYTPQIHIIQSSLRYRESPTRRFWRALVVAVLVWFLVTVLVQSIYGVARRGTGVWSGDFSIPSNVVLSRCPYGEDWSDVDPIFHQDVTAIDWQFPYASRASFELPLSSKTLFLLSRGSMTSGTVKVVTSDEVSDVVKVHVVVKHYNRNVYDQGVKVCLIERSNDEIGVGYFTRRWNGPEQRFRYEATVVLPATKNRKPLHIQNFETDIPNISHQIGDLQGLVEFSYIDLKGSNAPISATSISADTGVFHTSNSPITGVFNATRSLTLKTSNAPIKVDVGIRNDESYVSELTMRTSNGGRYIANALSSNGPVYIKFPTTPLDSTLKLQVATSNSPAVVTLDPAYQGSLSLATSNFAPILKRKNVEDPTGKGRKRTIKASTFGRAILRGSVSWSGQEGTGNVDVKSSNAPVTLEL
ncbi:hypothetical protein DXG03_002228 [Asterophora parasitica]|uniref:Uncharacterized protein n=1 Tax=Asterophora parasitica TaxID=117018 RepID=A0A9P7GBK4_9AGAR|nr:hypothetical protein DXG03_002228 [Asterophora parasitica]